MEQLVSPQIYRYAINLALVKSSIMLVAGMAGTEADKKVEYQTKFLALLISHFPLYLTISELFLSRYQ
jgi:hypothetical protein